MSVKLALTTKGIVLTVVAVAIVEALILNPIRFHQAARGDGYMRNDKQAGRFPPFGFAQGAE